MIDLTSGSILSHLLRMSAPVLAFMIFQALYLLVDLYFVSELGDAAIAGVGLAANVSFMTAALVQILGVGTGALISHAAGRKDQLDAVLVFNQAMALSLICGLVFFSAGSMLAPAYLQSLTDDANTLDSGMDFLRWYIPALSVQFAFSTITSALRATGVVRPTMVVYAMTLSANIILAPVLIKGWGIPRPMGVAGAGFATLLAMVIGLVLMWGYFIRREHYIRFSLAQMLPQRLQSMRILNIGLPAGGEMAINFVYTALIFWVISPLGAVAQAGFGVGSRIVQVLILPAIAVAMAAGPIAGQNFGAGRGARVKLTFWSAAALSSIVSMSITILLQFDSATLVRLFTTDENVVDVAALFLRLSSLALVGRALVFTCASLFQGLGNTIPSFASSGLSLLAFVALVLWLPHREGFQIEHVWYGSIATVVLQAGLNLTLLRSEFRRRLEPSAVISEVAASEDPPPVRQ